MARINLDEIKRKIRQAKQKEIPTNTSPQESSVASKMTQAEYDNSLKNEIEANPPHNQNPFDFVFFSKDGAKTYSIDDLDNNGRLQSGYIKVTLKALTPLHIVGKQEPVNNRAGEKIKKSYFYQQDNQPCIPGSSIKGMLRSFIEAVTNGWVSQAQDKDKHGVNVYKSKRGVRHIEFASWEEKEHNHKCLNTPIGVTHKTSTAIPITFRPTLSGDRLDIATYLFGYVDEKASARAGKIIIEDAYFNGNFLKDYNMVDVDGEAIMGGPIPRANWWYMRPKEVWDRSVQGVRRHVAHIVGDEFWGRKFYYHQDPEKCIQWYKTPNNWAPLYDYKIQCLDKNKETSFFIYFDRVPEKLIKLFCTCLCMPAESKMRHKLGYGKAFGYGSVEFSITSAMLRTEKSEEFPAPLSPQNPSNLGKAWSDTEINCFIDTPSLNKLARILTWDVNDDIIFTYPPYNDRNFNKVIQSNEYKSNVTNKSLALLPNNKKPVSESQAIKVARGLWDIKRPIHFQLYQAKAKGFNRIKTRKP